jgi:hypothetical protein
MEKEMVSRGAIEPSELDLFTITDDHDEIMEIIKKVPITKEIPFDVTPQAQV